MFIAFIIKTINYYKVLSFFSNFLLIIQLNLNKSTIIIKYCQSKICREIIILQTYVGLLI